MKKMFMLIITILSISLLAACGNSGSTEGETSGDSGDGSSSEGETYTVATDANFKPFEFKDPDTGEMTGFDIELLQAIADEEGFQVEFKTMKFAGLLSGLQAGRYPIGIAGISITDERKEKMDFSDPYYDSGLILMVPKDSDIQSIDDVDGKSVGTRQGSTSEEYLNNKTDATVESFPDIITAYMDVKNGRLDAALYDLPNVQYFVQQQGEGELKTVGDVLQGESYGIALPKDSDLTETINSGLQTLKDNGTYDELYEKYFGEAPE
ncbi:transporter substrate-binding domain-containing protein [Pontibacillus salicampi]|uniref:Transporter substrate-binding domain-containing protein n=1 Tax=Pontibacillus salicampi TaxID=1449801 RepID=A0ABV6LPR1_9BACI